MYLNRLVFIMDMRSSYGMSERTFSHDDAAHLVSANNKYE